MVRAMTTGDGSDPADTTQRRESARRAAPPAAELGITWFVGGELGALTALRGARIRIGRSEECEIYLEHPSVSRLHAELQRQGSTYVLRDFESTNGTWVNALRVEQATLSAGDVLRCGDCVGVVGEVPPGVASLGFGKLASGLFGGPATAAAVANARRAATSDVPIVLVGETGTGKERIARAIHEWSGRAGQFVAVNSATIPATLAEAELFGHQRGAFTGAERARDGFFQAASGGTLFLDEIADLPPESQAKLLRATELGEVMPLGSTAISKVDVRLVVAALESLPALVEQRRFRADLAARLSGFVVEAPPLRKRRAEIPGFFLHFLTKHGSRPGLALEPVLVEWLCLREWPGNLRELELLARKLLALHGEEPLLLLAFAEKLVEGTKARRGGTRLTTPTPPSEKVGFQDRRTNDLQRLRRALERTNGNLTAAAESIGISRRRAYRLLDAEKPKPPDE